MLDFLQECQKIDKILNGINGAHVTASSPQQLPRDSTREGSVTRRTSFVTGFNSLYPSPRLVRHAVPVHNCSSTCPLDSFLLNFLHKR